MRPSNFCNQWLQFLTTAIIFVISLLIRRTAFGPTPQQAATLPKREGGREGDRVFIYATKSFFKSLFQEDRTQQISSRSPSRFGRVAACCGVGSQGSQLTAGWVPKGRSLLRGGFPRVAACCGVGSQGSQLTAGWVPKGRSLLRGGFPRVAAYCGVGSKCLLPIKS